MLLIVLALTINQEKAFPGLCLKYNDTIHQGEMDNNMDNTIVSLPRQKATKETWGLQTFMQEEKIKQASYQSLSRSVDGTINVLQ